MKEDEMGRACSGQEEMRNSTKFWLESLKGRDHSEDLGVDGRIILKWTLGIHWAQERDQWRTFMNTVMNLRVP
jgi:hypothetical protein